MTTEHLENIIKMLQRAKADHITDVANYPPVFQGEWLSIMLINNMTESSKTRYSLSIHHTETCVTN
jgi:hypothetical protein